jgi:spermidine/putrescine-binding protein
MNMKLKKILSVITTTGLMAAMVLSFGACSKKSKLIIYNWGDYIGETTMNKFQSQYPQY